MPTTTIILYAFWYTVLFLLSWKNKSNNSQRLINNAGVISVQPVKVIAMHCLGIFWLGLFPMLHLKHVAANIFLGTYGPSVYAVILYLLAFALVIKVIWNKAYRYKK